MSNKHIDVAGQLPLHFQEFYPKFIRFLELYYEWLYRNGGYTEAEILALKADPTAIQTDIDRFLKEGNLRNFDANTDIGNLPAVIEIATQPNAGTEAQNISSDYLLERTFDFFESADGEMFETSDENLMDASHKNEIVLESWFKKLGYDYVHQATDIEGLDRMLIVRLLKHIHNIKGTAQAMKVFFMMFFKEDVEIYFPKMDIAIIDDNFIPDSLKVIRDDNFYQEYSYVIYVDQNPSFYSGLFNAIYMKLVHPAGFKAFLLQKQVD